MEIRRTDDVEAALGLGTQAGLVEMEGDLEAIEALWGAFEGETLTGVVAVCSRAGLDVVGWPWARAIVAAAWAAGCWRSSRPRRADAGS